MMIDEGAESQPMSQMSVEFRMKKDRRDDWQAQYTGLADFETATAKAAGLWKGMTKRDGEGVFEMRICETPFGRVLATVEDGKVVAETGFRL
jgi:hypothetical protein